MNSENIIKCIQCGRRAKNPKSRYCINCGARLPIEAEILEEDIESQDAKNCPKCGFEIKEAEHKFCINCGNQLKKGEPSQKSREFDKVEGNSCPRCNYEIKKPTDRFCTNCGYELIGKQKIEEKIHVKEEVKKEENEDLKLFCTKCGFQIPNIKDKFCIKCGNILKKPKEYMNKINNTSTERKSEEEENNRKIESDELSMEKIKEIKQQDQEESEEEEDIPLKRIELPPSSIPNVVPSPNNQYFRKIPEIEPINTVIEKEPLKKEISKTENHFELADEIIETDLSEEKEPLDEDISKSENHFEIADEIVETNLSEEADLLDKQLNSLQKEETEEYETKTEEIIIENETSLEKNEEINEETNDKEINDENIGEEIDEEEKESDDKTSENISHQKMWKRIKSAICPRCKEVCDVAERFESKYNEWKIKETIEDLGEGKYLVECPSCKVLFIADIYMAVPCFERRVNSENEN